MRRLLPLRFWLVAMLLTAPAALFGQAPAPKVVGRIIVAKVVGTATVTDVSDPMRPRNVSDRDEIHEGQIINTGADSRVLLVFSNGATINLGSGSILAIDEFLQDPFAQAIKVSELTDEPTTSVTKLNLLRGELLSNVKHLRRDKGSSFSVQTPVGAAGIRGTTFQLLFRPAGNVASFALRMIEGRIALNFGGLSRSIEVEKDKQVVLDNIPLDPAGRVLSLPANIVPTDLPASTKAALALAQQQLLEAAASVSFAPLLPAGAAPGQAYPQGNEAGATGGEDVGGTDGNGSPTGAGLPVSAVPPPTVPPPRTTPGDGQP